MPHIFFFKKTHFYLDVVDAMVQLGYVHLACNFLKVYMG